MIAQLGCRRRVEWQGPVPGICDVLGCDQATRVATVSDNSTIRKVKFGRRRVNYQPESRCFPSVRRRRVWFIHTNILLSSQGQTLKPTIWPGELQCSVLKVASRWPDNPAAGYGTMDGRPILQMRNTSGGVKLATESPFCVAMSVQA
jgi:hypothetical protein